MQKYVSLENLNDYTIKMKAKNNSLYIKKDDLDSSKITFYDGKTLDDFFDYDKTLLSNTDYSAMSIAGATSDAENGHFRSRGIGRVVYAIPVETGKSYKIEATNIVMDGSGEAIVAFSLEAPTAGGECYILMDGSTEKKDVVTYYYTATANGYLCLAKGAAGSAVTRKFYKLGEANIKTDKTLAINNVPADAKRVGDKINDLSNALTENLSEYTIQIKLESGGLDSNGLNINESRRLRSIEYIPVQKGKRYTLLLPDNEVGATISISSYANNDYETSRIEDITYNTPLVYTPINGVNYIRCLIKNQTNTSIGTSDVPYAIVKAETISISKALEKNLNNNSALSGLVDKSPRGGSNYESYASGMCMAQGKMFLFFTGNDDHSNYANCNVYDLKDRVFSIEKQITHNFGHVNNASYCEKTDCLMFGNASGEYSLPCKFYVYPNFFSDYNSGKLNLDISDAIEYDCTSILNGETQCNAFWGDDNLAKYDLAIVNTNDNQKIRIVQLGTGENQLENGVYTAAPTGAFNGTFKIQKTYTQDVGEIGKRPGQSYQFCAQDGEYRNGEIWVGIGHSHFEIWKMKLNDLDDSIVTEVITKKLYDVQGNESVAGVSGIELINDYLIIFSTDQNFYTYKL